MGSVESRTVVAHGLVSGRPRDMVENCSSLAFETVASWPECTSSTRMSIAGYVSEREIVSTRSASQRTVFLDGARSRIPTRTSPR